MRDDIIVIGFYICLPFFLAFLFFGWLVFLARGSRSIDIALTGFGVSLNVNSKSADMRKQLKEDAKLMEAILLDKRRAKPEERL